MDKSGTETPNKEFPYDTKMLMYFLAFCIAIGEYDNMKNIYENHNFFVWILGVVLALVIKKLEKFKSHGIKEEIKSTGNQVTAITQILTRTLSHIPK